MWKMNNKNSKRNYLVMEGVVIPPSDYRDQEIWPDDLPDPGPGMHWNRKENPYYIGGFSGKYLYFKEQNYPGYEDFERAKKIKANPSLLGQVLESIGYNYLGPGTDFVNKRAANIEPVNELDRAAMIHDGRYYDIERLYSEYRIDDDEAARLVKEADEELKDAATKGSDFSNLATSLGMRGKVLWDSIMGPSFITLKRGEHWQPEPQPVPPVEPESEWDALNRAQHGRYHPGIAPGSGSTGSDISGDPLHPVNNGLSEPFSVYGAIDRNNNGIPDVLERKSGRKRKLAKRYFPYRQTF